MSVTPGRPGSYKRENLGEKERSCLLMIVSFLAAAVFFFYFYLSCFGGFPSLSVHVFQKDIKDNAVPSGRGNNNNNIMIHRVSFGRKK